MKCLTPQATTVLGFPVRTTGAYVPRSIQAMQGLIAWRNENADAPDAWLRADICTAFQFFIGLRLGQAPAVETLPITAEMWIEVIGEGMNEEQDRERIRAGFKKLRRELKWWPQPEALLKVLPRRTVAPQTCEVSKTSQVSDEDHARAQAEFEKILTGLVSKAEVKSSAPLDRAGIEKMKREFLKANHEH